jgi:AcrR family transcriptional regulator
MRSASSERRDREAAFRLDLLLDAAESAFLEKGFAGAPVEEIARRAGVALATLYKSFPSKEDAYRRVLLRRIDQFHAWIRERSAEGSPIERLEALVRGTLSYFEKHEAAFRLYMAPQGVPWNIRSGLGTEAFERYLEFIGYVEGLCRAASGPGRKPSARLRALAISGTLNNVIVDAYAISSEHPALEEISGHVWTLLKPVACGGK